MGLVGKHIHAFVVVRAVLRMDKCDSVMYNCTNS